MASQLWEHVVMTCNTFSLEYSCVIAFPLLGGNLVQFNQFSWVLGMLCKVCSLHFADFLRLPQKASL